MTQHGKKYLEAAKKVDSKREYSLADAVKAVKDASYVTFNETPYKILSHDGKSQTYSLPSGFVFRSKRVDGKFVMPPCELVS